MLTTAVLAARIHRQATALQLYRQAPDPEARVWLVASDLRILANQLESLDPIERAELEAALTLIDDEAA